MSNIHKFTNQQIKFIKDNVNFDKLLETIEHFNTFYSWVKKYSKNESILINLKNQGAEEDKLESYETLKKEYLLEIEDYAAKDKFIYFGNMKAEELNLNDKIKINIMILQAKDRDNDTRIKAGMENNDLVDKHLNLKKQFKTELLDMWPIFKIKNPNVYQNVYNSFLNDTRYVVIVDTVKTLFKHINGKMSHAECIKHGQDFSIAMGASENFIKQNTGKFSLRE
jgi:hypothetical protein